MKRRMIVFVLGVCLLLMFTGCESKPRKADNEPTPTGISSADLTPMLAREKGCIETEWFQDCDISFFCGDGQETDMTVVIPFVVSGKVSTVSLVEESFIMGDASIGRSFCFQTEDIDENNERCVWYLSIEMKKPTFPCEITQVTLMCDGEEVVYPFGRMYAVDAPNDCIFDLKDPLAAYAGVTFELPEDPMNSLPFDMSFAGSVELFESGTSSDELIVDAESMEQYYRGYRKNDKEEIWLTFDSPKSKYRFFEIYCVYAEKNGQKKAVRAYAPCRNRPIVVYWNRLQNRE